MGEHFVNFFSSVFVSDVPSSVADNLRYDNIIDDLFITTQIIEEIINKLNRNFSMGGEW